MAGIYGLIGFTAGTLFGVLVSRYWIGLTTKLIYKIKEDVPLTEEKIKIEQEFTDD